MIKEIEIQYVDNYVNGISKNFNELHREQTKYVNEIIDLKYKELIKLIESTEYEHIHNYYYQYRKNSILIGIKFSNSIIFKDRKQIELILKYTKQNSKDYNYGEEYSVKFTEKLGGNIYELKYLNDTEIQTYKNTTSIDILEFFNHIILCLNHNLHLFMGFKNTVKLLETLKVSNEKH